MWYIIHTNYDLTEGRGWEIPTTITQDRNVALWYAHTYRPFYGQVQGIHTVNGADKLTYDREHEFLKTYPRGEIVDPELNAQWKQYEKTFTDQGRKLPEPPMNPQTVYVVGYVTDPGIGGTVIRNQFMPAQFFTDYNEAQQAAIAGADAGNKIWHIIALETDTYCGTRAMAKERIFTYPVPKPAIVETEQIQQYDIDELTDLFTVGVK